MRNNPDKKRKPKKSKMKGLLQKVPDRPPCDSEIFGYGRILDTIQRSHVFEDSKTFVDLRLKKDPIDVIKSFEEMMARNPNPSNDDLKQWVGDNFSSSETELLDWDPEDFKEVPDFINDLTEKPLIYVAKEVNLLWNVLGRKSSTEVNDDPDRSSLIFLPHGFVIPGGRFREIVCNYIKL